MFSVFWWDKFGSAKSLIEERRKMKEDLILGHITHPKRPIEKAIPLIGRWDTIASISKRMASTNSIPGPYWLL